MSSFITILPLLLYFINTLMLKKVDDNNKVISLVQLVEMENISKESDVFNPVTIY